MRAWAGVAGGALALGGCSGGGGTGTVATPIATASPTPAPAPTPAPMPVPTPTPSPTPSPAATYLTFAEVYTNRVGRDLSLASACAGAASPASGLATVPVTAFGQGLMLRFVLTPQVWAIGGDGVALSFDGRTADVPTGAEEVAYREVTATHVDRFAIERPASGATAWVYARTATVATRVAGVDRRYTCLTGMPTLSGDLPAAASGGYPRTAVLGTAFARDAALSGGSALAASDVAITTDLVQGRVSLAFTLGAGSVALGRYTVSATIDPVTGNFGGPLTSADRGVAGTLSGRLFGPQGTEIGAVFGGTIAGAGGGGPHVVAGTIFGAR